MSTIESLLSQIGQLASTADLSLRYRLSDQLQRLARSIATPRQTMQHIGYTYTEQTVAKIAADLGIFGILAKSEGPLKIADIASKSGGDSALIDRILRNLAANYLVAEVDEGTFAANETTRLLASPPGEGNIRFGFSTLNEPFQELPAYLKANSYKNPDQLLDTAFHRKYDTKLPFFVWMQQDQERIRHFHPSLTAFEGPTPWTSVVPLAEKLQGTDEKTPLFVDLGGGHGYQCSAFRKATRDKFPGRVINQDLPQTLAEAPKYDDIEMMAQDFFQEQQIQGASIYYIRQCLHDLPDAEAKQVLQRIRDAMGPNSFLLIDELVIPATGASRFSTQLDFTMMAMFSSTERTVPHWKSLLGEVGLEITQVYRYDPEMEYSILEAVPIKS